MKPALALAAALCCAPAVACTSKDAWTGQDKRLHFGVGVAVGTAGTLVTENPHIGFALGAAVGAAKELRDRRGHGTCSFQDFAITALGAAAGAYGTAWIILPRKSGVFFGISKRF